MKRVLLRTVLVTGFEPFGGDPTNPSQDIARQLHGRMIGGRVVTGALLPCVFGAARRELTALLRRHRPELVICLGLAAGRAEITPERVAINVDDARIPDNAGQQPVDRPVVRGGPAAYFSTLPVKAIVAALRRDEVPASVSQTAGTFVCNHVFYSLMHTLAAADRSRRARGGFIHVPCAASPGESRPALALEAMTEAVATAIAVSLRTRRDRKASGGTVA